MDRGMLNIRGKRLIASICKHLWWTGRFMEGKGSIWISACALRRLLLPRSFPDIAGGNLGRIRWSVPTSGMCPALYKNIMSYWLDASHKAWSKLSVHTKIYLKYMNLNRPWKHLNTARFPVMFIIHGISVAAFLFSPGDATQSHLQLHHRRGLGRQRLLRPHGGHGGNRTRHEFDWKDMGISWNFLTWRVTPKKLVYWKIHLHMDDLGVALFQETLMLKST